MTDKKKRISNFSNNEKNILIELVNKYKDVVENKRTDCNTNAQKVLGWARLAQEYNSISTECYRNANNLKTCWENIKRQNKKEVASRKKEMFKTGGGNPQPPMANSNTSKVVETILGPALEGLPNIHDSDAIDHNDISTDDQSHIKLCSDEIAQCNVPLSSDDIVITVIEEEKENYFQDKSNKIKPSEPQESFISKKEVLWESWTPKTLKRPLAEPLQSNNSGEGEWIKRRRPKAECSSDALLKEKIDLVKILKKNAEEEGNLRILILKEQLRQEKIKTENLLKNN